MQMFLAPKLLAGSETHSATPAFVKDTSFGEAVTSEPAPTLGDAAFGYCAVCGESMGI